MTLDLLRSRVREIGSHYQSRHDRARRLFVEERAASLHEDREREYAIKNEISNFFGVAYSHVCFTGSGQLGFSIVKERLFEPAVSDLDAACIDADLFQQAWIDVIDTSKAFTDSTVFGGGGKGAIDKLKDQMVRRGMIMIDLMPASKLKRSWTQFQGALGRRHVTLFRSISIAIYMNEYAFCWKQDSALSRIMR